ncbi:MAG: magnesium-translocating P-type ATPase [Ignavibacteria bacterium]|nr:magnesium-translocating P-type ATPase [Ignavibacteria bacterium]
MKKIILEIGNKLFSFINNLKQKANKIAKLNNKIRTQALREKEISLHLFQVSRADINALLLSLKSKEEGLTNREAENRLREYGKNEISHEKPIKWYSCLLKNFYNPFIVLLITLAIVSYFLHDTRAVIVLSSMVSVSVFMRFIQEFRANKAVEKLKEMVRTSATVIRENEKIEIPMENLVKGDIITLSAGDLVPADVRIIKSKDLYISQSILSGESLPVEKYDVLGNIVEKRADELLKEDISVLDIPNIALMGTNVVSGTAIAIVIATGDDTLFGSMSKSVTGYRAKTSFDKGINSISWLLIRFALTMMPVVLLINGFTKGDWFEAVLFALSIGVGLTPEMLPMIVTANLALGAVKMSKQKVIVKRLNAIQNFGAMDILCCDKTGTLTEDRIILEYHLDLLGEEDETVFEYALINSYFQTGLKSLLDKAILEHQDENQTKEIIKRYFKTDEIPFDFQRRRMSVAVHQVFSGKDLLVTKGAVEEILSICSFAKIKDEIIPLDDELKNKALLVSEKLNSEGLRVIAVSYKELYKDLYKPRSIEDESEMVLVGYIAFLDPPKESARKAIKALKENGVNVKILTGDNDKVTRRICNWLDIEVDEIMLGYQIDNISEEELEGAVEKINVFAKMNPLQKSKIIKALQRIGHTVGYMGDGINDAAALRDSDVGISVNTAVDIAKESADIILLEKSLLVLEEGVLEGRKMFGNIIKYIKMTASSNFGNVFSVLGASAFLPFLPMMPVHLLTQNLLYDLSQTMIPFDNVDKEFIQKPKKWDAKGIGRFMLFIGPISSLFDYITYLTMWFIFEANTLEKQALFQSGWFIEGLLSQTLIVHMIRTQKIPFIQSMAALPLILTTIIIISIGIAIPFTSFGATIGLVPLPSLYFLYLTLILLSYCLLTQFIKLWFIKKFNYWL